MIETSERRPLVRPAFLKWSTVAFAILLPFVIHSIWSYVEARRLMADVVQIRARQEPVMVLQAYPYHEIEGEAAQSDRSYRAASVLASQDPEEWRRRFSARIFEAERANVSPDDLLGEIRRYLDDRDDALRLLDRATPLVFKEFSPGTDYSYRTSTLFELSKLAGMRTTVLALDGAADQATNSLYAEFRMRRVMPVAGFLPTMGSLVRRVGLVIEHGRPSAASLQHLASALAEVDRDDSPKRFLTESRARYIESAFGGVNYNWASTDVPLGWRPWYQARIMTPAGSQAVARELSLEDTLRLPLLEREVSQQLEYVAPIIAEFDKPWPAGTDAVMAESGKPLLGAASANMMRYEVPETRRTIQDLALIRCAEVAVAGERYRRDHHEEAPGRLDDLVPAYLDRAPIDPYSGQPLRFTRKGGGYSVYSVGSNKRDDGGSFTGFEMVALKASDVLSAAPDFGIHVQ